jgi:phage gp46-like protein
MTKTIRIENAFDIRELVLMSIGTDKGTWWRDPAFGSELWLLKQNGKVSGETAGTLKRMILECLKWLADDGLAQEITCAVERTGKNTIAYHVMVTQPAGGGVSIEGVWNVI